ncbi:MAG: response regulator transcription factor [Candidatus Anammoxibacter sp.]
MKNIDKVLLLVEPNRRLAYVLEKWLTDTGYSVAMAYDLKQAFSKIRINPDMFHMCIVDADFPGGVTEGLDVCRKLKSTEITKSVPVVVMAFSDKLEDVISGLDAGADMFLLKPFETEYFLERVKLIIDDLESKKYMKGVIDFALLEFLFSLKGDRDTITLISALTKGFNCTVWNKIMPIMGFGPLRIALENAKGKLREKYGFVKHIIATENGFEVEDLPNVVMEISQDKIVAGFVHLLYHFFDIITTLTGNIVVDMDSLKIWDTTAKEKTKKSENGGGCVGTSKN